MSIEINPQIIIGIAAGIPALIGFTLVTVATTLKLLSWKKQKIYVEVDSEKSTSAANLMYGAGTVLLVGAFCGAVLAFVVL